MSRRSSTGSWHERVEWRLNEICRSQNRAMSIALVALALSVVSLLKSCN